MLTEKDVPPCSGRTLLDSIGIDLVSQTPTLRFLRNRDRSIGKSQFVRARRFAPEESGERLIPRFFTLYMAVPE